jgi:hypothetical protein
MRSGIRSQDFAGPGADHGEAQDAVVAGADHRLYEAGFSPVASVRRTWLIGNRPPCAKTPWRWASDRLAGANGGSVNMTGHLPVVGPAASPAILSQTILKSSTKISVNRGLPADRPYARSGRLKALVDTDEAARIELEPGLIEIDIGVLGTTAY